MSKENDNFFYNITGFIWIMSGSALAIYWFFIGLGFLFNLEPMNYESIIKTTIGLLGIGISGKWFNWLAKGVDE